VENVQGKRTLQILGRDSVEYFGRRIFERACYHFAASKFSRDVSICAKFDVHQTVTDTHCGVFAEYRVEWLRGCGCGCG
jgi:hypothetical protein